MPLFGSGRNKVLIIGEHLNQYEYWLEQQFRRAGVDARDLCYFDPNVGPESLQAIVSNFKPMCIVTLGPDALKLVTGLHNLEANHGYTLKTDWNQIPAIAAYHPGFIQAGQQKYTGAFIHIIKKALAIAAGTAEPFSNYTLITDPSPYQAHKYLFCLEPPFDSRELLVCDIETAYSPELAEDERKEASFEIVRISFSNQRGTAISFPWMYPFIDLAARALAEYKNVVFWNQDFDAPRLAKAGAPVVGTILDAMWGWHFLQSDLPKALGFAAPMLTNCQPWKYLNSAQPAVYSALDSAITMDCWLEICNSLAVEGRLDAFHEQCTRLMPVLANASREGMFIDKDAQQKLLNDDSSKGALGTLTKERDLLFDKIQSKIPQSILPTKAYKKGPKSIPLGCLWIPNPKAKGGTLVKPFNPGSSLQKKKLFTALGLKIPYNKKRDSETIESKHLRKHAKKFPVLRDLMDYGERNKIITSYTWELDENGFIHPRFGFNPSTWRKSCFDPNIQTIPKRSNLAKEFRKMFVAPRGFSYIECDSSAIEAVLVGFFANSPEYIALAKRGVHKWLAEKFAGRPVSKEEPLYDKIKRIVHLSNYLGTPSRITEEYPDDFATVQEAAKLQEFYFSQPEIAPVRQWQQKTLAVAAYDKYLQTPFGQRHYFYDVLKKVNEKVGLGNDAKRAIAFMPQASASAIQTRFVHWLPQPMWEMIRAIIHDSIVMLVPDSIVEEMAMRLHETMTKPLPELNGMYIGAEVKIGKNLGEMITYTWERMVK